MLCWLLAKSDGHFWWPREYENMANLDFKNLKHLQSPGHLILTKASMSENDMTSEDQVQHHKTRYWVRVGWNLLIAEWKEKPK